MADLLRLELDVGGGFTYGDGCRGRFSLSIWRRIMSEAGFNMEAGFRRIDLINAIL